MAGLYNVDLHWSPDNLSAAAPLAGLDGPPSLFAALEAELGLKLVAAKGTVQVLVIDTSSTPQVE